MPESSPPPDNSSPQLLQIIVVSVSPSNSMVSSCRQPCSWLLGATVVSVLQLSFYSSANQQWSQLTRCQWFWLLPVTMALSEFWAHFPAYPCKSSRWSLGSCHLSLQVIVVSAPPKNWVGVGCRQEPLRQNSAWQDPDASPCKVSPFSPSDSVTPQRKSQVPSQVCVFSTVLWADDSLVLLHPKPLAWWHRFFLTWFTKKFETVLEVFPSLIWLQSFLLLVWNWVKITMPPSWGDTTTPPASPVTDTTVRESSSPDCNPRAVG